MSAYVGPPLEEVRKTLEEAGERFATLLRQVTDTSLPAIGVWNVGETAAHVAISGGFFRGVARGERTPEAMEEVAEHNARFLAGDPERDPLVLAERFEENERRLIEEFGHLADDPTLELFRGLVVPTSSMLGVELGEVLIHGWDIARACGLPWTIEPDHAAVALASMLPVFPASLDRQAAAGFSVTFEMRLRGNGRAVLVFDDGSLHLEAPSGQAVDFTMSVDPTAYLLIAMRRIPQWKPMLQGKVLVWGRRPWLAATILGKFMVV